MCGFLLRKEERQLSTVQRSHYNQELRTRSKALKAAARIGSRLPFLYCDLVDWDDRVKHLDRSASSVCWPLSASCKWLPAVAAG
mmetsp:Transcript_388/g.597  ORF Transcript_388/g.597 Transcript_388/m.597 type:complete len:84 (+) Transcript_388:241-492(+)